MADPPTLCGGKRVIWRGVGTRARYY